MTADEWATIVALISANWPHSPPPENALAKWKTDLDDLPPAQVITAVEALYRNGREFPPNGAQIRANVVALDYDFPTWGEAWATIRHAIHVHGHWDKPAAMEMLLQRHPVIAAFAERVGWQEICCNEDPPGVTEGHNRRTYEQMVAKAQREQAYTGLPAAGLRALERVNRGPRRFGGLELVRGGGDAA